LPFLVAFFSAFLAFFAMKLSFRLLSFVAEAREAYSAHPRLLTPVYGRKRRVSRKFRCESEKICGEERERMQGVLRSPSEAEARLLGGMYGTTKVIPPRELSAGVR